MIVAAGSFTSYSAHTGIKKLKLSVRRALKLVILKASLTEGSVAECFKGVGLVIRRFWPTEKKIFQLEHNTVNNPMQLEERAGHLLLSEGGT